MDYAPQQQGYAYGGQALHQGGPDARDYDMVADDRRRERSKSRERRHKSSKSHKRRDRSRSRDRRRSRSRDSRRRSSRSRSRSGRRRQGSRSRSRHRGSRSHRRGRSSSSSRSRSPDGYKPRRRQAPPKPAASMFAANDPFAHLRRKQPVDPAEALRQWQEEMLKSRQLVLAQQAKSAQQQANRAQRELYIGNLAAGQVSDSMLAQVFNSALVAAFPEAGQPGQEPVLKVSIHTDGRYGFVELRTPEYATAALDLTGQIVLMGTALSIGRPASYVDPQKVNQAAAQAEAALAAFKQGLPLPPTVDVPTPLVPGTAGAAMAAAGNAVAGTHNAAAVAAGTLPPAVAALAAGVGALGGGLLPTPYVELTNMITADVLEDGEEYEEVLLDLREECERFGDVVELVVPRPADPTTAAAVLGTGNYGKAFVSFRDVVDAAKARERLHGRMFAGRMVTASYVTPDAFAAAKGQAGGGAAAAADAAATAPAPRSDGGDGGSAGSPPPGAAANSDDAPCSAPAAAAAAEQEGEGQQAEEADEAAAAAAGDPAAASEPEALANGGAAQQ